MGWVRQALKHLYLILQSAWFLFKLLMIFLGSSQSKIPADCLAYHTKYEAEQIHITWRHATWLECHENPLFSGFWSHYILFSFLLKPIQNMADSCFGLWFRMTSAGEMKHCLKHFMTTTRIFIVCYVDSFIQLPPCPLSNVLYRRVMFLKLLSKQSVYDCLAFQQVSIEMWTTKYLADQFWI